MSELRDQLAKLSSAEDFLNLLGVPYDEHVVQVNRLHILKRFHDYLKRSPDLDSLDDAELRIRYVTLLTQAYNDFVTSDAVTEKVFKVFHQAMGVSHVGLDKISRPGATAEG
ncbi:nitrogen fixation protein NifW [Halothiobacillus diazotrophicus]|uniref:Nitrogenase-stabilizing/protective protein NifW n=1 Tax=Halothiobacillus diazotrophicus TaxID=1860122 RepID=A0A191ZEE2_9GAMM|nr:nitrogenase-stabilizing/protective protein NifW [Halothiobacillus diazotrophicus]ANJ66230.1 nitrogen fixation protein NifW [Halothiobacillus diazotrophicus]